MTYHVELVEPVVDYLSGVEGLSADDCAVVLDGVVDELSRDADRFLALRPLSHESLCFRYDYAHVTASMLFDFDFVIDASHRAMGVVRVAYVECRATPVR